MVKKLILGMAALLAIATAQAQRFEWAKGYGSGMDHNEVVGTVADRDGNLYVLGKFQGNASWDGEELTPMTPWGGYHYTSYNVLIAKISPAGEMVWKKVIHNQVGCLPYDIKMVGDTAIACMVDFSFAGRYGYLYWLDTMIVGPVEIGGPYPSEQLIQRPEGELWVNSIVNTALLIFSFNGELLERHILQTSYIDTAGNDYLTPSPYWGDVYRANRLEYPAFDIDREGNIYIYRLAKDELPGSIAPRFGNVGGVKFWVNNRHAGTIHIDRTFRYESRFGEPQVLKFSPHFDTLLSARYLLQRGVNFSSGGHLVYLRVDREGNPYVFGTFYTHMLNDNLPVDSARGMTIPITEANRNKGFLVKFDSTLTPLYCVSLEDSVTNPAFSRATSTFRDISFDYDSNLLFLFAGAGRSSVNANDTGDFHSIPMFGGVPLTNLKNDAFFLAIHLNDGAFHSYGRVPSVRVSTVTTHSWGTIVGCKNRVFLQCHLVGGVRLPTQNIRYSNSYESSWGFLVFDYGGNVVDGQDYSAFGNNKFGSITLVDSILYLSNNLQSSATFGDIEVPALGNFIWFAKYVDTSFMTPYVAPAPGGGGDDPVGTEGLEGEDPVVLYPNPTTGILHVETGGERIVGVTAVSVHGQRHPLHVSGNRTDLSALPAGIYILEIMSNNNMYNFKIIKQ